MTRIKLAQWTVVAFVLVIGLWLVWLWEPHYFWKLVLAQGITFMGLLIVLRLRDLEHS